MSTTRTYARWTREDKLKLLHGLKKYGYREIRNIAKLIPNKSTGAIRTMIYKYLVLSKEDNKQSDSLDEWLNLNVFQDEDTMIPQALLYMSLFEDHPSPTETGGVDVKAFYNMLYHASNYAQINVGQKNMESLNSLIEVLNENISSSTEAEVLKYLNSVSDSNTKPPEKVYSKKEKNLYTD